MTHGDIEDVDVAAVASYIKDMVGIGVLVPDDGLEDYIRRVGHLPARVEDTRTEDETRRRLRTQNAPETTPAAAEGDSGGKGNGEIPDDEATAAKRRLGRFTEA